VEKKWKGRTKENRTTKKQGVKRQLNEPPSGKINREGAKNAKQKRKREETGSSVPYISQLVNSK
jgi:hypothetical protein